MSRYTPAVWDAAPADSIAQGKIEGKTEGKTDGKTDGDQAGISRRDTLKLAAAVAAFGVAMGVPAENERRAERRAEVDEMEAGAVATAFFASTRPSPTIVAPGISRCRRRSARSSTCT